MTRDRPNRGAGPSCHADLVQRNELYARLAKLQFDAARAAE